MKRWCSRVVVWTVVGALALLGVQVSAQQNEPQTSTAATPLDERLEEMIAFVRDQPPVHEREAPWTVPVRELQLELQPLRTEQIQERLELWLEMLQQEIRRRIRMDIATDNASAADSETASADAAALSNASDQQQLVVDAIVARTNAIIEILKARGEDTSTQEAYIRQAQNKTLNWSNPTVLLAQLQTTARNWFTDPAGGPAIGLAILKALGVLLAFWVLSRILGGAARSAVKRVPKASSLLQNFIVGGVTRLTMVIGLVVAVSMLGIDISPLVAAIAAAGLVIGLALQGTLSNFASGILILIYRPYDVGDVIDGGGVFGKVEAMNLVSTKVVTFDNQEMFVPNNQIWNGVITNVTGRDTRRVDMTFGIGYTDDIAKAQAIIQEIVNAHPMVLADPAPVIKLNELGDSSVNFVVRPWSKTSDYWDVYWDVTRAVKERFDAEGVSIPFPQQDMHLPGPIEVKLAAGLLGSASNAAEPKPAPPTVGAASGPSSEPGPAGDGD
ncbi:MAG: mechanosensitive ion channel family protein [Planctomycetota bacterium]